MRRAGVFVVAALALATSAAHAQNVKETCVDSSERGQKLVDDRKLLLARNAFLSCAQDSCPGPVRRDCQAQLDDLKKNIPTVVIRAKLKDGSDATGWVFLDGTKIGTLDGQRLELDPGTHRIHVETQDGRVYDRQVIVAAGERDRAVLFDANAAPPTQAPPPSDVAVKTHWSTVKTIGFAGIWIGSAAIVGGVVSQLLAFVFQSNATTQQGKDPGCVTLSPPPPPAADPNDGLATCNSAVSYHQQAVTAQGVAIGLGLGGLATLVTGIVMYAVGGNVPDDKTARVQLTPLVSPTFAGLGLGGSF
jgi:hypothetical protein